MTLGPQHDLRRPMYGCCSMVTHRRALLRFCFIATVSLRHACREVASDARRHRFSQCASEESLRNFSARVSTELIAWVSFGRPAMLPDLNPLRDASDSSRLRACCSRPPPLPAVLSHLLWTMQAVGLAASQTGSLSMPSHRCTSASTAHPCLAVEAPSGWSHDTRTFLS